MNQQLQKQEQQVALPTIEELRAADSLEEIGKSTVLNVLLNQQPDKKWLVKNKYANDSLYIPIARLEWLMTRIFVQWHTEVRETNLIANSIAVTVRVHYLNPVTGEWCWTDGVGAAELQTDKDASATDFSRIKSSAVQIGFPKAKTEAIKDAIGDLGRLFGRDVNRKDLPEYDSLLPEEFVTPEQVVELEELFLKSGADREAVYKAFLISSFDEMLKSQFESSKLMLIEKAKRNAK